LSINCATVGYCTNIKQRLPFNWLLVLTTVFHNEFVKW